MAQQDTGLGWSAKDEYLVSGGGGLLGKISEYEATGYPAQPLPYTPTNADLSASGLLVGSYYQYRTYYSYLGCATEGVSVFVGYISSYDVRLFFNAPSFTLKLGRKTDPSGSAEVDDYTITGQYDSTSGLYWANRAISNRYVTWDTTNVFDGNNAANIIVGTETPFYKLNAGYAVCCFAKWYSPSGDEILSPVLISSNADYATISLDGSTPATQGRTSALWQGMYFTMSYIPNFTGTVLATVPVLDLRQFAASTPEKILKIIANESLANIVVANPPDPYNEPPSEEGGGDGENDEEDDVDFTDPPSTSIGATGLLTIFCPNLYQLQSLGTYMWSTFDVDNWRKIIANPMDAILGLHVIPVPAVITGTKAVKVAGIDTTIDMSYTTVRYIRRTMGTCEIPKKWGAYLDYSPYTKISIFLPFIGFKELDADDVMGKTIALQYIIDILTGACVAELKCGDTVLYTWSGNCANEVPISGSDWRGAIASAIGIAATVAGTALVTGGATAPMAASMVASVGANSMNLKPTINRSGAISGSAGYMGQKRPYIIRSIPNLVIPADQNKFIGYPSFVTTSLGSLTGYNEIASVHLEGIPATGNELAEIETLLKGGVIF